jgi:hexosaminidase
LSWPVEPSQLTFNRSGDYADEAYTLRISKAGVLIEATSDSGKFYAEQTLKQLVLLSKDGTVPCLEIDDAPRYGWRGFMLDESRHFFGKEKVKQFLDQMALYKLNRLHWHLTDNQTWRIEIKKYPKLTSVGAARKKGDPLQFYTQEDIQEIVKYASERFITIVPEIDMPGHAQAACRAYPEFSGLGPEGREGFTFNPGSEPCYQFLTDVLTEVSQLFPGQWIHYGGDEVSFRNSNKDWPDLPGVKKLMARERLQNNMDLEHYFNRRMANVITDLGRVTAGWDEVASAGLDKQHTLVMWWRQDKSSALKDAFAKGFNVVLCPRTPLYFDFVQDETHTRGRKIREIDQKKGIYHLLNSLDTVYAFPASHLKLVDSQVAGIQANLWTETVVTEKRLDFMTYPRLQALAESAWTQAENKNYEQFLERLKVHLRYMENRSIYFFNPFDKHQHPEPKK